MKARGDKGMIRQYEKMSTEDLLAYACGASEARIKSKQQQELSFDLTNLLPIIPEEIYNDPQQRQLYIDGYKEIAQENRGDKK